MSKSTRLTLICHGATTASRTGAFPRDEPLTAAALDTARLRAGRIRHAGSILTSPALRARQTAEALSLTAACDVDLADLNYGHWAGQTLAEVEADQPDAALQWLCDPQAAPHGGESIAMVVARISVWLEQRIAAGDHIVAVTHAAVIRAAIVHVLDAPLSAFWKIDIAPLTMTELSSDERRWTLRSSGRPLTGREGETA